MEWIFVTMGIIAMNLVVYVAGEWSAIKKENREWKEYKNEIKGG